MFFIYYTPNLVIMQETFASIGIRQKNFLFRDRISSGLTEKGVVHMMMSVGSYVRQGRRFLRRWTSHPRMRQWVTNGGYFLAGLGLSAASLGHTPQPLVLAALCAGVSGMQALLLALGGGLGYWLLWGSAGLPGVLWSGAGLGIGLCLGGKKVSRHMPMLLPVLAGVVVSVTGLVLQLLTGGQEQIPMYLLQIGLGIGSARVFSISLERRAPVADWLSMALGVLALAQIAPVPMLGLGFIAAGLLTVRAPLPAVALAGLALDLAQVTSTPMTAVVCLAFLLRLIPGLPKWGQYFAPGVMYLLVTALCGGGGWYACVPLAFGGGLGTLLPPQTPISHRRGETGLAQVRLELAAAALGQTEQILSEVTEYPIDEGAIIQKAAERACGCCPCRKNCPDLSAAAKLPASLLHRPLVNVEDLHFSCRKRGRLLLELRRGQDQYRTIRADRDKQKEYRVAVVQQYRFLCDYLQELSDQLPRRGEAMSPRYRPEISVQSAGLEAANGDRCLWFAGGQCQYYVLLCDGMGTGMGAEAEGKTAAALLKRLLTAGYPPEHALRSLNSLCTLRGSAGAVTVDLAQLDLRKGRVTLYKWGAAPSWLLSGPVAEKIGTAGAPPGLSITDTRETVDKLSLRRGETLILLSDGVDGEAALRRASELTHLTPGEMAPKVLQYGRGNGSDDATAAVIRLYPQALST